GSRVDLGGGVRGEDVHIPLRSRGQRHPHLLFLLRGKTSVSDQANTSQVLLGRKSFLTLFLDSGLALVAKEERVSDHVVADNDSPISDVLRTEDDSVLPDDMNVSGVHFVPDTNT